MPDNHSIHTVVNVIFSLRHTDI